MKDQQEGLRCLICFVKVVHQMQVDVDLYCYTNVIDLMQTYQKLWFYSTLIPELHYAYIYVGVYELTMSSMSNSLELLFLLIFLS